MNQKHLIKLYFSQSEKYHSSSKDELVSIRTMPRVHAGNAAEKLARDAAFWAAAAGVETPHPIMWMTGQPLFIALYDRSAGLAR